MADTEIPLCNKCNHLPCTCKPELNELPASMPLIAVSVIRVDTAGDEHVMEVTNIKARSGYMQVFVK